MDLVLVVYLVLIEVSVLFMNFFDGFRISYEI